MVILDGGLATHLEALGADLRDELWSAKLLLENPAVIRQAHLDYFAAGAEVATTASYQASIPGFVRRGLDAAQAEELIMLSVDWPRRPATPTAGRWPPAIGPYGPTWPTAPNTPATTTSTRTACPTGTGALAHPRRRRGRPAGLRDHPVLRRGQGAGRLLAETPSVRRG